MFSIFRQTFADFSEDKCSRIAAALAYYTAFSLAPMLLLVISVCQLVFEAEDVRGEVQTQVTSVVGPEGADQIKTMLDADQHQEERGAAFAVASAFFMLLGATGLFVQLQHAMNDVWEVQPDPNTGGVKNFLVKRLVSLGMVLTIAFLLVVSLAASAALHAFDASIDRWLPGNSGSMVLAVANYAVSFLIVTFLFAAMFKFLPDVKIDWSTVWMGAATTAFLFMVGKFVIAMYVGNKSMEDTYGAAGSLMLILMWVYYSALIFLFGAEFTQVWAKRHGHGIVPDKGAVRVVTHTSTHSHRESGAGV